MDLGALLRGAVRDDPARLALAWDEGTGAGGGEGAGAGGRFAYGELANAVERCAAGLAGLGLAPGDRVALLLGNGPELVVAHLALLRLGVATVPLNLAYRRRELGHILADAEPRLLIADRERAGSLDELDAGERASLERVLAADEVLALAGDPAGLPPPPDGDALALLLYTSGTTGRSKGAMLSHDNLLATVAGLAAAWRWRADDVLLLALPLFHMHGLVVGLHCALAAGAAVLLRRRFDAARVRDALAGEGAAPGDPRPTLFFGVPTMYVRLVDELERRPADLRSLRLFCSGSAPLAAETFGRFAELTGHQILERYGMTETGMNLSNLYPGPRLPGTVGWPLPGVSARVVDAAGAAVAPGAEGELQVAGANVFRGYWRNSEATGASFTVDADGVRWFATGDLARRDPRSGAFTLLGRRHELILCGGFNVYPREIEEALLLQPGVREAAVAGVSDPDKGEVPVAWLVVDGELDEEALRGALRRELAAFKLPRRFVRVAALPRNALGKVQKHLLPR
jgi:malonyl-CoA/methylmalonyl-CoA synthetase